MNTLSLEHISKHYGKRQALNDFSATFEDGIYGLLGPNGAGKSTLMNIITQNIRYDKGGLLQWNKKRVEDLKNEYRGIIGFMPQQQELYPTFTARSFVGYMATLKGVPSVNVKKEVDRVLSLVGLLSDADKKISGFSGGMKQRALIAQAMLGEPKLLVLDEPTAGLDPKQRVIIRNMIQQMSKDKIVIISTHIVSDIEDVANNIIMMDKGRIIDSGSVSELYTHITCGDKNLETLYMQYYGDKL